MRWERLFDELEGSLEHEGVLERDALVEELREGEWSQVSWSDLLRETSDVELQVCDVGPVRGEVRFANQNVIHLVSAATEHIVSADAVTSASGTGRPEPPVPGVLSSLGWGHVLRTADADAHLRFVMTGGQVFDGTIDVVGSDFVRLLAATGAARVVPFAAIQMVSVVT